TLKPEHSGVTIEGAGPGTFLRNSHHTATYPANSSFVAMGTGVGYADQLTEPPNGTRLSFVDNVDLDHYPVGGLLYAYVFDGYTKAGVGQLAARRRVVRRVGLRAIEVDRPIDPRCNSIKWVDGEPLTSAKEGDRVLALAHDADPTRFAVGSTVYVTDGP